MNMSLTKTCTIEGPGANNTSTNKSKSISKFNNTSF
jgi:hypothetical protein